tara:strand:+ start:317 stop:781 length:465 start_codon:yes stop_codon:yes gene_type:complete
MFIRNEFAFKNTVPEDGVCCVYLLFCNNLGVIYVGQTIALAGRISGHKSSGKKFDYFEYMICDPSDANEIECREMVKYNPPLNTSLPETSSYISIAKLKKILITKLTKKIDSIVFSIPRAFDRGHETKTSFKYVEVKYTDLITKEINKLSLNNK